MDGRRPPGRLQGRRRVAALTLLASAGMAVNAVTCFCGLNAALGLDTTDEGRAR